MFNQKPLLLFVFFTTLLGGLGAFFIYNLIFDSLVLSIIIGVTVAIFIAGMEVLFAINTIDRMRYRQQRDLILQSLEKRSRHSGLKAFFYRVKLVKRIPPRL